MTEAITRAKNIMGVSAQALLTAPGNDQLYFDLGEVYSSSDALPLQTVVSVKERGRTIVLYNPLAHERLQVVTIAVDSPNVMVGAISHCRLHTTPTQNLSPRPRWAWEQPWVYVFLGYISLGRVDSWSQGYTLHLPQH